MKFSIMVCSLVERMDKLNRLLTCLRPQLERTNEVELLVHMDSRIHAIGKKRNLLLQRAQGEFTAFIDDDDLVSDDYVSAILKAITSDPGVDVIGLEGIITFGGQNPGRFIHSITCGGWYEKGGIFYRTPNHLNPVKSRIARAHRFEEINFGEDQKWSESLAPQLKTEVMIDHPIYFYRSGE